MKKLTKIMTILFLGVGGLLSYRNVLSQDTVYMVGNTHVDAVWLWDREEAKWVCQDTFWQVLDLMRDYPQVHFSQSSAQFYKWIEENDPATFRKIQDKVKEGKWEIVGGMWIEPDGNMPSGESLVRQILYGQQYFRNNFGEEAKIAWFPDTFGLNYNLPQILKRSGIDYLVTAKLNWNDTNKFPHNVFWWESADGSRILSVQTPGRYNEEVEKDRIIEQMNLMKAQGLNQLLYLYGLGDHGGGPNQEMMERAQELSWEKGFPELKFCKAIDYFEAIQESEKEIPVWNDELYLEYHRGTLTNHQKIKYYNRKSEVLLNQAETFSVFAWMLGLKYPQKELEGIWEKVLFNQFHDILPGTSIKKGMDDALNDYQEVIVSGKEILNKSLGYIAAHIDLAQASQALVLFNSLSWERDGIGKLSLKNLEIENPYILDLYTREFCCSQIIEEEGEKKIIFLAKDIPSFGYRSYDVVSLSPEDNFLTEIKVENNILENSYYRVEVDSQTGLVNIFDRELNKQVVENGNMFCVFNDNSKDWPAWNIGPEVKENIYTGLKEVSSIEILEKGPLRAKIKVKYEYKESTIETEIILYSQIKEVEFNTKIDWHQKDTLLKVAFPYNFSPKDDLATYEIPFGSITRKIIDSPQANNFEKVKYEMSGLKWVDVSCAEYGISLLNDSKYGFDVRDNMLRMSILRAKKYPDPSIMGLPSLPEEYFGLGKTELKYALFSHKGDWKEETVKKGYEFNYPLLVNKGVGHQGSLPLIYSFLQVAPENVILTGLKKAQIDEDVIIRIYEYKQEESDVKIVFSLLKPTKAWETDLMERKISEIPAEELGKRIQVIRLKINKNEIKTVKGFFYDLYK